MSVARHFRLTISDFTLNWKDGGIGGAIASKSKKLILVLSRGLAPLRLVLRRQFGYDYLHSTGRLTSIAQQVADLGFNLCTRGKTGFLHLGQDVAGLQFCMRIAVCPVRGCTERLPVP